MLPHHTGEIPYIITNPSCRFRRVKTRNAFAGKQDEIENNLQSAPCNETFSVLLFHFQCLCEMLHGCHVIPRFESLHTFHHTKIRTPIFERTILTEPISQTRYKLRTQLHVAKEENELLIFNSKFLVVLEKCLPYLFIDILCVWSFRNESANSAGSPNFFSLEFSCMLHLQLM